MSLSWHVQQEKHKFPLRKLNKACDVVYLLLLLLLLRCVSCSILQLQLHVYSTNTHTQWFTCMSVRAHAETSLLLLLVPRSVRFAQSIYALPPAGSAADDSFYARQGGHQHLIGLSYLVPVSITVVKKTGKKLATNHFSKGARSDVNLAVAYIYWGSSRGETELALLPHAAAERSVATRRGHVA